MSSPILPEAPPPIDADASPTTASGGPPPQKHKNQGTNPIRPGTCASGLWHRSRAAPTSSALCWPLQWRALPDHSTRSGLRRRYPGDHRPRFTAPLPAGAWTLPSGCPDSAPHLHKVPASATIRTICPDWLATPILFGGIIPSLSARRQVVPSQWRSARRPRHEAIPFQGADPGDRGNDHGVGSSGGQPGACAPAAPEHSRRRQRAGVPAGRQGPMGGHDGPSLVSALDDADVIQKIYAGLVKQVYDDKTKQFKIVPDLAAGMPTISKDGLTYTFKIRPDAKFSDGTPVTAQDFVWSFTARDRSQGAFRRAVVLHERHRGRCGLQRRQGQDVRRQGDRRAVPCRSPWPIPSSTSSTR